ncbi:MAG TPA: glycosyltransferase family 2 protein [Candidatus Dormibacteraeota bacterium]|nr:glycosyltransferase family 2 protein [Candidatus Dormibacteraeota bacterium]
MSQPVVSVVTPFHNVAPYLVQCIESVLAQSFSDFEYILSDNWSTDGSTEIAEAYARRDPRIRLIRQPKLLSQVAHYNAALAQISPDSEYCKIVQADDSIFPECLQLIVKAFEQSRTIGLVSAYYLKGNVLRGSGFPYRVTFLPGKDMARLYLRTGVYVFGSPTVVSYRSSLVRATLAFYDESLLHEDTEKCVQILENWDFGFVHQVLSFLRTDNDSISSAWRNYQPESLDWYIIVQRFAPIFLDAAEAAIRGKESKRDYYRTLTEEALRLRSADFWHYHSEGIKTLGESLDRPLLAWMIVKELLWLLVNPGIMWVRIREILQRLLSRFDAGHS